MILPWRLPAPILEWAIPQPTSDLRGGRAGRPRPNCATVARQRPLSAASTRPPGGVSCWKRTTIDQFRTGLRGAVLAPGDGGLRLGAPGVQRDDRPIARADRAVRGRGGRQRSRALRPRAEPAHGGQGRRAQRRRPRHLRRRAGDRSLEDEGGPRRSRGGERSGPVAAAPGATSIMRPTGSAWPRPPGSSRPPGSEDSRSAAGSATCRAGAA